MKTARKLTALVLMMALLTSTIAALLASAKTFSDVPSNHWDCKVIDEISNDGTMIGTGIKAFSLETNLTKAEYTTVLNRIEDTKSNGSAFDAQLKDVDIDA